MGNMKTPGVYIVEKKRLPELGSRGCNRYSCIYRNHGESIERERRIERQTMEDILDDGISEVLRTGT